jgi:hypothetical protein
MKDSKYFSSWFLMLESFLISPRRLSASERPVLRGMGMSRPFFQVSSSSRLKVRNEKKSFSCQALRFLSF